MTDRSKPVITHVMRFANGMVAVFDQHGQQMPEYQGTWDERRDSILRDKPADVLVDGPVAWTRDHA
jgi:hypothetical protein